MMMSQLKTPTEWAQAVATRAGNYARAVANGSPHDLTEAKQLLENCETLCALIADEQRQARTEARKARRQELEETSGEIEGAEYRRGQEI